MFARKSTIVTSSVLCSLLPYTLGVPLMPKRLDGKPGRERPRTVTWQRPSDPSIVAELAGGYGSNPIAARQRAVAAADVLPKPERSQGELNPAFLHDGCVYDFGMGWWCVPMTEGSSKPVNGRERGPVAWDSDGFNRNAPDYGLLPDRAKPIGDYVVGGRDGERFPDAYGVGGVVRKDAYRVDDDDSKIPLRLRHGSIFKAGVYNLIVHRESLRASAWCRGRIRGQAKRGSVWDFYGTIRNQLETRLWMIADRMGRLYGAFPIEDRAFLRIVGRVLYGRRTNQTYRPDDDGIGKIGNIGRLRYPRRMPGGLAADLVSEEQLETAGGIVLPVRDEYMRRWPWGVDPVKDAEHWAKYMAMPERTIDPDKLIEFNVRGAYTSSTGHVDTIPNMASANESRSIRDGDVRAMRAEGLERMVQAERQTILRVIADNVAGSLTDADLIALRRAEAELCKLSTIAGTYHFDRIVKKAKRALWTARIMDRDLMIQRQTSESWKPGQIGVERIG